MNSYAKNHGADRRYFFSILENLQGEGGYPLQSLCGTSKAQACGTLHENLDISSAFLEYA